MGNKSFFQFIQIILLTLSAVGVLSPIKSQAQEIDYLALAHVLLRDGNYQRAQGALANAKKDWDLIEVQNYYLLNGLYLLRTKKFNEAEAELAKVTDEDYLPQKWAYLTEVYLAQNKKGEALKSIGHFVTHKDSAPSLFHLKAKVYFENQKPELAVDQLNQVLPKKRLVTYRLLSHYLMEMELTREALKVMYEMLDIHGTLNEELHLQSAQLLISKNKVQEAIVLLERASLLFASSADVAKLLAAAYDLDKKPFVAGDLYTKLAYLDSSYSHMAAEYLMQKGRIDRAQVINVMVKNPKEQLTQKLSFYIERERFDLARSLETPLKQYGAYEDDEIKYAMAYTFLMQGDYDHSKGLLKSIKKEKLISKSSKLMELVSECQNNHWECYGTL